MSRTPLAAAVAAALLVGVLGAAPARADGPHDGPVTVETEVPAGGTSSLTSQTLPKDADGIKVTVKPNGPSATESDVYDHFLSSLGTLSKQGRLLVCTMLYQQIATLGDAYTDDLAINVSTVDFAGTVLLACLQMAGLLQAQQRGMAPPQDRMSRPVATARATTACEQARPKIASVMEKTDDGWRLTASGATTKAKPTKIRVGCRERGQRVTFKVRSATKGVPLRRALGKKTLKFGLKSPGDASTSVPVSVTFDPF